jgi:DNA-binding CsgD family transcriptional regulator
MRKLEKFQRLQALPVSTAVLDGTGRIVAVNDAWKDFGSRNGLCVPHFGVGTDYFAYCLSGSGAGDFGNQLRELLDGKRDMITMIYPCDSPTEKRWFFLVGMPLSVDRPAGIAILHAELTSLLPLPAGLAKSDKSTASMLGVIEHSVADTLTMQLRSMLEERGDATSEMVDPSSKLSKRQLEVLKLLGEGKTNAQIAEAIFRSPHTVKLHVSAILKQLNLKSRTQAALLASKLWADGGS